MELRKEAFKLTLIPYIEQYGQQLIDEFYAYWTEPNKSGTKFKMELHSTWALSGRLATWAKNDKAWNKRQQDKPSYIEQLAKATGNEHRISENQSDTKD